MKNNHKNIHKLKEKSIFFKECSFQFTLAFNINYIQAIVIFYDWTGPYFIVGNWLTV